MLHATCYMLIYVEPRKATKQGLTRQCCVSSLLADIASLLADHISSLLANISSLLADYISSLLTDYISSLLVT